MLVVVPTLHILCSHSSSDKNIQWLWWEHGSAWEDELPEYDEWSAHSNSLSSDLRPVILFSQKCVTPHCHAPPCLVTNISRVWFIIIISALKQWRDTALVTTHEISREQSFSSILTSWCRCVLQIFSQYCWLWSLSREHQTHSAIREIWSSDTMKIILKKYCTEHLRLLYRRWT